MRYDVIKRSVHHHYLKPKDSKVLFRCDGCNQYGIGSCYRCDTCNFDLHYHCAKKSMTISPPFYHDCSFKFMNVKTEPPEWRPPCKACGKNVKGFFYCCKAKGVNLHPCCAKLPEKLEDRKKKLSLSKEKTNSCLKCKKERSCWSYKSSHGGYTLHVPCAREMLVESWRNGEGKGRLQAPHKRTMLLLALRFMISALVGDPSTVIAAIFHSLMS